MKTLLIILVIVFSYPFSSLAQKTVKESAKSSTLSTKDTTTEGAENTSKTIDGRNVQKELYYGDKANLSLIPTWVFIYPGATDTKSTFHSTGSQMDQGSLTFNTKDNAKNVIAGYKNHFETQKYNITTEMLNETDSKVFGVIMGEIPGRSANVVCIESSGNTQVTINYNQKKQ